MEREPMNVLEQWPLYDTIMIGPRFDASKGYYMKSGWYADFAQIGAVNELAFFNQRVVDDVGLPYNNQEARDSMPYGFTAYSYGVIFMATPCQWTSSYLTPVPPPESEQWNSIQYFLTELPKHAGIELKVGRDIKVEQNCLITPAGVGTSGNAARYSNGPFDVGYPQSNSGAIFLKNRWKFPTAIDIPATETLSAKIRFTEYGRFLLQEMGNSPFYVEVGMGEQDAKLGFYAYAGIQISLLGRRQVQQRGELHVK